MKYLIAGFISLLMACQAPSFKVCIDGPMQDKVLALKSKSRAADKSRKAVVKVFSHREAGTGFGTGTVFKYKGQTIVLTAAHVIGEISNKITVSDGKRKVKAEVIYFDSISDLAALRLHGSLDKQPIPLRPRSQEGLRLGEDVFYSGFPNDSDMLTIKGYIAGVHPQGHIYMHSYGWPGASGSAVLDEHGRLVGVLFAVDVGTGIVGFPSIIEDVVIVVPIWKMNFDLLDLNL